MTTSDGVESNAQVSGGSITAKFAQGGKTLYFTSPASWPSDIAAAYNGKLSFMTNPAEYASAPHLGQHTLQRSFVQTTLNHSTGTPSARCSNFTCRYTGSFISATGHQSNPSGSSLYVAPFLHCISVTLHPGTTSPSWPSVATHSPTAVFSLPHPPHPTA